MDLDQLIQAQMRREEIFVVEDTHTAMHVGSGASRVLATPWMIAFMERAAHRLLAAVLPAGFTSVGVLVNIRHLAPTPAGSQVRVSAEVLEVDAMKVKFQVEVWDEQELAGSGIHERFVIDTERFLRRVEKKRLLLDQP